ncbi:MAG: hypothetical protein ACO3JG_09855 [Luteolibacter sp.]
MDPELLGLVFENLLAEIKPETTRTVPIQDRLERITTTPRTPICGTSLRIRTAETSADWQIAHTLLDDEHLLGAGREAGDRLCQFVLEDNQFAAKRIRNGRDARLALISDALHGDAALEIYRMRWGIETLFSHLKRRAANSRTPT